MTIAAANARKTDLATIPQGVNGLLDRVPVEKIGAWEKNCECPRRELVRKLEYPLTDQRPPAVMEHIRSSQQDLLAEVNKGKMTPELDAQLKKVVQEHVSSFVSA